MMRRSNDAHDALTALERRSTPRRPRLSTAWRRRLTWFVLWAVVVVVAVYGVGEMPFVKHHPRPFIVAALVLTPVCLRVLDRLRLWRKRNSHRRSHSRDRSTTLPSNRVDRGDVAEPTAATARSHRDEDAVARTLEEPSRHVLALPLARRDADVIDAGRSPEMADDVEPSVKPIFRFEVGGCSRKGQRYENQDAWIGGALVLGVADGVGGRPAGRDASLTALKAVADTITQPRATLVQAARRAHNAVREEGKADGTRARATTLDVVRLDPWGELSGVHVGDSRVYVFSRRSGLVRQVTTDHAQGNDLTRSVGGSASDVDPDIWIDQVEPGDRVVVATDGLWNPHAVSNGLYPGPEDLIRQTAHSSPQVAARDLVDNAIRLGSTDNVTVVVGDIVETGVNVRS